MCCVGFTCLFTCWGALCSYMAELHPGSCLAKCIHVHDVSGAPVFMHELGSKQHLCPCMCVPTRAASILSSSAVPQWPMTLCPPPRTESSTAGSPAPRSTRVWKLCGPGRAEPWAQGPGKRCLTPAPVSRLGRQDLWKIIFSINSQVGGQHGALAGLPRLHVYSFQTWARWPHGAHGGTPCSGHMWPHRLSPEPRAKGVRRKGDKGRVGARRATQGSAETVPCGVTNPWGRLLPVRATVPVRCDRLLSMTISRGTEGALLRGCKRPQRQTKARRLSCHPPQSQCSICSPM